MRDLDIAEVAQRSGVPASTLRFYEEKGLIAATGRRGLRRLFDPDVLERLALIALGGAAGFSLDEIARMFAPDGRPRIDRQMLAAKAEELDRTIRKLSAMRDGLRHAAACRAPSHLECPTFRRLLRAAASGAIGARRKNNRGPARRRKAAGVARPAQGRSDNVGARSVANNLNGLGKVHPDLLMRTCATWLEEASAERRVLVEHALRSAVKRGEADALRLLGFGKKASVSIERVRFEPKRVAIGGRVSMSFVVRSKSRTPQDLLIDFAVHFVKARGSTAPKVFKLTRLTLPPRGESALSMSISLAVHTTRKPQPGVHAVDVVINGKAQRVGSFLVTAKSR